jgi:hypothetical protein
MNHNGDHKIAVKSDLCKDEPACATFRPTGTLKYTW